ncbi:thiamine diphosphokinase [Paenibacillus athensensis]|uniref:Thiamine diphosphokinase n=1 Tax=Paenibacillus athensensis TaxID=1967502 RepID=A0A4Y8Q3L6_9BACL|nr:thiamine diphosphokinase [Paenibacillus athensensis]MCD1258686.1 thiamine diphosphokinase [Paenibacillus athensensis]
MDGQRIVIVTGGTLGDWALREIADSDVLVGSDRGALFLVRHGLTPDVALGDFDSVTAEEMAEIRVGSRCVEACDPIDKNWTDTEMAFAWALERRPASIVLLGALGTRFDHSLANVHLLHEGLAHGIACSIIDACNEVRLIDRPTPVTRGRFTHVSLLPLSPDVRGITLHGFQYPLNQATLRIGQSLGISNVLLGESGLIELDSGLLLVIQSTDPA